MSDVNENDVWVVLCTCPDDDTASSLARELVETRLAACVNIVPEIRSVFRWQGEVQSEAEALMVVKTTAGRYPALEAWLLDNHPYDVPEVLALPVENALAAYGQWVAAEVE
ncbi:MAG: divalent-cation tolerance protein CutA [Xanthomonadales bacterium]|nr:divalent-cation tolerance protein CutA [Xanthomonadales bacterium]